MREYHVVVTKLANEEGQTEKSLVLVPYIKEETEIMVYDSKIRNKCPVMINRIKRVLIV